VNDPVQQQRFLTAEWKNLLMLNYDVEPVLLAPFVPPGTEIDAHNGRIYMSLIGFEFNQTRVLGFRVPFHQQFEEVNLRFYVRRGSRRGVVFIRELVPKFAVSSVARLVYGENYRSVPMSHRIEPRAEGSFAEYCWGKDHQRCAISANVQGDSYTPDPGSLSQFISEHYWGYSLNRGRTIEYQVDHPQWSLHDVVDARLSGDPGRYCGHQFSKILAGSPVSAFFSMGSEVIVFSGHPIG
jgi:uncharacterized protein YqjF (DUF2071 family)